MSIYHNGKEYGTTKVINYSASPDYNRGVTVDNIQTGNYQATDNGFLMIQLQSQQSNPTKVSVVRSTAPITDTGTEIASIVLSQYQYSETLTAQVMARDYYKLAIEGAGNPQVLSCMFYPYATNVPIKLTEDITMEQVAGLENELDGKQDKGNYFNKDTDKINLANQVTGVLGSNNIANDAITGAKIADNAIKANNIASSAITSLEIASKAIQSHHITDATITGVKLANKTITAKQIADNTITANQLASNSVGASELGYTPAKRTDIISVEELFAKAGVSGQITTAALVTGIGKNYGNFRGITVAGWVRPAQVSDLPADHLTITIQVNDVNGIYMEARPPFADNSLWIGSTDGGKFGGWKQVLNSTGQATALSVQDETLPSLYCANVGVVAGTYSDGDGTGEPIVYLSMGGNGEGIAILAVGLNTKSLYIKVFKNTTTDGWRKI